MANQIMNQAFLLLCNGTTSSVINAYQAIHNGTKRLGDSFVLYHQKTSKLAKPIKSVNHFAFRDEIITRSNYFPIGFSLVPGNNHFPLLQFYINNPHYQYYWCIEDDVKFSGKWRNFFETFSGIRKDFITCHLRTPSEEPGWYWWSSLAHPYSTIPLNDRIRSFNPIYRISNDALDYIHRALLSHWCGHHEVLLATLLYGAGFKLMDFGGKGKFVPKGFENKFYTSNIGNTHGTMRWRPAFTSVGPDKNKLYHPVKEVSTL